VRRASAARCVASVRCAHAARVRQPGDGYGGRAGTGCRRIRYDAYRTSTKCVWTAYALLTLDDTVEFFNLVLGVKLTADEKKDLVTFLRALW